MANPDSLSEDISTLWGAPSDPVPTRRRAPSANGDGSEFAEDGTHESTELARLAGALNEQREAMTRMSLLQRADLVASEQRLAGPMAAMTEALGALTAQVAAMREELAELRAAVQDRRTPLRRAGTWNRTG